MLKQLCYSFECPLECKVMNIFSIVPAFCAVKLSCSEMNKMGFKLAFWAHNPHTLHPFHLLFIYLFIFANFAHLPQVLALIFFPSYISLAPSFSSPSPVYPRLNKLCLGSFTWLEERRGEG